MGYIESIENELKGKTLKLSSLNNEKTALFVVDMVNGFVYNGILSSPRVAAIVDNIVFLNEKTKGYRKVFFIDSHDNNSSEFNSYPKHCIKNSQESSLIDALKTEASNGPDTIYVEKNCTNGFLVEKFQDWLNNNIDNVNNFIVTGCVTDICILQLTLAMKAFFNEKNKDKRIIVPINAVDTYDVGSHNAELMNLFALYNMHINGIEVVDKIN